MKPWKRLFSETVEPNQIKTLTRELMDYGFDSDGAYEIAIDFVSGPERREDAYRKVENSKAVKLLMKHEHDLEYDSIFPGV
jgi:hypothetical protein